MKVFILLSIVVVAFANPKCDKNSFFDECGPPCPITCDNYNEQRGCIPKCEKGCYCDMGYFKNSEGKCVTLEECPAKSEKKRVICGENERYLECGTACPLTCDNYANPPKICPAMCVTGCHCGVGYVKARDGRCVRPEDCQNYDRSSSVPKACKEEKVVGPCKAAIKRFFFNKDNGRCEQFTYGGCQGNSNNFNSQDECEAVCFSSAAPTACLQEKVVGPCKAAFKRFYFNKDSGKCEEFTYGGCDGNSNNFNSQEGCEAVCIDEAKAVPKACLEDKVVGPCRGGFRRFFFNKDSGKCEEFIYGGCQGNSNNFNSQDECEAVCSE